MRLVATEFLSILGTFKAHPATLRVIYIISRFHAYKRS